MTVLCCVRPGTLVQFLNLLVMTPSIKGLPEVTRYEESIKNQGGCHTDSVWDNKGKGSS